jgi:hypothetical protein
VRPRQLIFFKPENPSALGTLERLLLRCCAIAAPVLGVLGIGRLLRLDEANSVLIASSNLVRIVEYLRNDYKLPAYYVLLHRWIGGTGIARRPFTFPPLLLTGWPSGSPTVGIESIRRKIARPLERTLLPGELSGEIAILPAAASDSYFSVTSFSTSFE